MLRADYNGQNCSIARALEVVGERWTILILREAFLGTHRFDEIQAHLGVARNVLQTRLERLVDEGILKKVRYQERPPRYEYRLTAKGVDLWPVIVSLLKWGDQYEAPNGPPVVLEHVECSGEIDGRRRCMKCGADVEAWDVRARRGPGAILREARSMGSA
jgi:DNA-binding HxlR family transcriptional regulator